MTQHLDEGTIHSWLDGALAPAEAEMVEKHVSECAQCADAVAEARGLVAASTRILSALDHVPARVIPDFAEVPEVRSRPVRAWMSPMYLQAAGILVVIGLGVAVVKQQKSGLLSREKTVATTAPIIVTDSLKKKPATALQSGGSNPTAAPERTAVARVAAPPAVRKLEAVGGSGSSTSMARAIGKLEKPAAAAAFASADQASSPLMEGKFLVGLNVPGDTAVYEGKNGVMVTLAVDSTVKDTSTLKDARKAEDRTENVSRRASKAAVMAKEMVQKKPSANAAAAPAPAPMNTIRWFDKTKGVWYSLSGRITLEQLDSLKGVLPTLRRIEDHR